MTTHQSNDFVSHDNNSVPFWGAYFGFIDFLFCISVIPTSIFIIFFLLLTLDLASSSLGC